MPAADLDQLSDKRGLLEAPIAAGLAESMATFTRINGVSFQKGRPRYELSIKIGAPLGHKRILSPTDRRYDMFNFTMSVKVTTAPSNNPLNNNLHAQLVARVDGYFEQLALASKDDLEGFRLITILMIRGSGIQPSLNPEEGTEQSTLSYSGQFGIRPDAWPV